MSDHQLDATRIGTPPPTRLPKPGERSHGLSRALGLNRNTLAMAGAMFLMALGEGLWRRFIPKYLQARSFPGPLRRLLLSDVLIRTCDALVDIFLVLYALNVVGIDAPRYGMLIAIQMATTILISIPASRIADRTGRKPFVIATFLAFTLFPLAVVRAYSFAGLVAAFVIGGLREIGEPARKALILDLVSAGARARSVGLYYLVRSVAIAPAATLGGLLWKVAPALPFAMAGAVGFVGTVVFAVTVDERYAG